MKKNKNKTQYSTIVTYDRAVEVIQRANPDNRDSRDWAMVKEMVVGALRNFDELSVAYDNGYNDGWNDGKRSIA